MSPSIITPENLRSVIGMIRSNLPYTLHLQVDPKKSLWEYYRTMGCETIVRNDKIYAMVDVPLLNSNSDFEVFKVIHLPIPFPNNATQEKTVERHKIETEGIAFNLVRTKFVMLSPSEALACSTNALKVCAVKSPIYAANGHRLCIVQLFKRDEKGIDKYFEAEVATNIVTLQAIHISDSIWVVDTAVERKLIKICNGK